MNPTIKNLDTLEKIPIKDRTGAQHIFLILYRYNNNIREYLLSMGKFKDIPITNDN